MDYPSDLVPNARAFMPGDWPIKTYKAMNGAELRILYGSERTGMELQLEYRNIPDSAADRFIKHYEDRKGTFLTFQLPLGSGVRKGWKGDELTLTAGRNAWRYSKAPDVSAVKVGYSNVTVNLIGVL